MIRFLARRLLNYIVLLVLASFLAFGLASETFRPLDTYTQRHPPPPKELTDRKAHDLGLDKPIPIPYAKWVAGVAHGDFGTTVTGHPVSRELAPNRDQSAAGGDRFRAGHDHRHHPGRLGSHSAVPFERPHHHCAVVDHPEH